MLSVSRLIFKTFFFFLAFFFFFFFICSLYRGEHLCAEACLGAQGSAEKMVEGMMA